MSNAKEVIGVALAALGLVFVCRRGAAGKRRFGFLLARRRQLLKQIADGDALASAELEVVQAEIDVASASDRVPPVYSPGLPGLGGFLHFASNPLGMVAYARKQLGDVFTVPMFNQNLTFLVGSEAHKAFFEAYDEQLDQAPVYAFMTPVFGKDVIYDAPIHKRRQQMRLVGSALNPSLLKSYPPTIAKEASAYFGDWAENETFDVLTAMSELTILTASATLHGREVREHLCKDVEHLFKEMDKGISPLSVLFPNAPTPAHRRRDVAHRKMIDLFSGVMRGRRESNARGSLVNNDILQKLMDASYKDGTMLPDHEIAGLLIALLFAGQHTSSITMTWTILFLLEDRRNGGPWLDRVQAELCQLEPSSGAFARGEVTYEHVSKMSVLHCCIKEAIRMFPPLIFLIRRVVKTPLKIGDVLVPVGHNVMVSNAVAQRLEEVFEDPNVYNPGRWSDFNIRKFPPYSFIGFGAGIHTCMGESFAFMQLRSVLAVLLSGYDLEMQSVLPEADYTAMVVMPKGRNLVKAIRRSNDAASVSHTEHPLVTPTVQSISADAFDHGQRRAVFSLEEVSRHDMADDCWLAYEGRVYDVTNYLPIHQGGDAILRWAGKDVTSLGMNLGPQHPSNVPQLLERYFIGDLKSSK